MKQLKLAKAFWLVCLFALGAVNNHAKAQCYPDGDPSTYGNNNWIVYAFNNTEWGDYDYMGYYTINTLNFNTANQWNPLASPSSAPGYQGCVVADDFFSFSAKRQGFTCGQYSISIPSHDDGAELIINGVTVWKHYDCCDAHPNVWTGWLNPMSTVELRVYDISSQSEASIDFNLLTTTIPGDPTVFGNNAWNVYALNNQVFAYGDYAGYYTSNSLNFNSASDWDPAYSPAFANGFQGCMVRNDLFSFVAKRKGFPCGYYSLDVPAHDNGTELVIDGNLVWGHGGCCDSHTNVWRGWLNANSQIEFRISEDYGAAGGQLTFNLLKTTDTSTTNISLCETQLPYTWNGATYNTPGTYFKTGLTSVGGCDSVAKLNLTVSTGTFTSTTLAVCGFFYQWPVNNQVYRSSGTYINNYVNSNGCPSADTLYLTLTANYTDITLAICSNEFPYQWNNNTITGAGTYASSLTNRFGCDSIVVAQVIVKPAPSFSIASSNGTSFCAGQNTTLSPTGLGAKPFTITYTGNSGFTTYTLTPANGGGAFTNTVAAEIVEIPGLGCSASPVGSLTGKIALISRGSCTFSEKALGAQNAGAIAVVIYNNVAGQFTPLVTDPNVTIPVFMILQTEGAALSAAIASGPTTASLNKPDYNYLWSNGAATASINTGALLANSNYNLKVTDPNNDCSTTQSVSLVVNPLANEATTQTACSSYTWQANGQTYTSSGTYIHNYSNSNGCTRADTLYLTIKETTSSRTQVVLCPSQLPYSWNGNNYNAAGTYSATLTGSNGCDSVATLELIVKALPSFTSITSDINPICTNDVFTLTVNGLTGENPNILWRTKPLNDPTGTYVGAGVSVKPAFRARTYYAIVQSACGYGKEDSIVITPKLSATYDVTQTSCFNVNDGAINNINVTGGTAPYGITFNPANAYVNTTSIAGLRPQSYRLYFRDANGCEGISSVVAVINAKPAIQVSAAKTDATCFNTLTGSINNITTVNGAAPYSYTLNPTTTPYQTVTGFSNLRGGNYRVFMQDANGCKATSGIINIVQPTAINISFTKTDASCVNPRVGSITVTGATGGSGSGYQFSLSPSGPFTANMSFNGLKAGNYRVYCRDGNGCVSFTAVIAIAPCPAFARQATSPTSLNESGSNEVMAYPNPTNGRFTMAVSSKESMDAAFVVSNSIGQPISLRNVRLNKGNNNLQFDLSNQPVGLYFIRITTKDGVVVKPIEKGKL